MKKNVKVTIYIAAGAIALYFAYQWYKNWQSNGNSGSGLTSGLGTNLNSLNPITTAGMDGSGLSYFGGNETIDITEPVPQQKPPSHPSGPPNVGTSPVDKGHTGKHHKLPKPTTSGDKNIHTGHHGGRVISGPIKPSHTTPATARTTHRALNTSSFSTTYAVKRTPVTSKPAKGGGRKLCPRWLLRLER